MSYDQDRQPIYINWTCCACRNCALRKSDGSFSKDPIRLSYQIYINMNVNRTSSTSVPLEERIPVGCTCAEPQLQ